MGLATTPGNSVSMATKGNVCMIWQMVLNSSSRLCAHTSRIPQSSLVVGPVPVILPPAAAWPFVKPVCTEAGLILASSEERFGLSGPAGDDASIPRGWIAIGGCLFCCWRCKSLGLQTPVGCLNLVGVDETASDARNRILGIDGGCRWWCGTKFLPVA